MRLKIILEFILEKNHLGALLKDVLRDSSKRVSNTVIWEIGISSTLTCYPRAEKVTCCQKLCKSQWQWAVHLLTLSPKEWPHSLIVEVPSPQILDLVRVSNIPKCQSLKCLVWQCQTLLITRLLATTPRHNLLQSKRTAIWNLSSPWWWEWVWEWTNNSISNSTKRTWSLLHNPKDNILPQQPTLKFVRCSSK